VQDGWSAVGGGDTARESTAGAVVIDLLGGFPNAGMLMRHSEREIHDRHLIDYIIASSQVLRLGLCKERLPYIVPVCFGYDGEQIYIHTSTDGMKIDCIAQNNQVCFEMEHDVKIIPDDNTACKWSVSFYSVVGFGIIEEIVEYEKKIYALEQIM
jgi:hypothetical protein